LFIEVLPGPPLFFWDYHHQNTRYDNPGIRSLFPTLPHMQIELSARSLVRPDMPIEALMTDFGAVFVSSAPQSGTLKKKDTRKNPCFAKVHS
jgi:hypothetical protein